MEKYFESQTASGNVQINDNFKNLYLSRKISVSKGGGSGTFQTDEFIAAIGNGTNSINGTCINKPGGYDYMLDDTQAYIYIFSNHPKSQGNNGLQVFNSSGDIIFDSNAKQAVVLACGGEGTSAAGGNLAICCGGNTVEAEKTVTGGTDVTSYGPYIRYKTVTEYEQKRVEYQDYVIENEYVNGKLTPVGKWVTKYRYDMVPVQKTVPEYYYTYTATTTCTVSGSRFYYNLSLNNGTAKKYTYASVPILATNSWVTNMGETPGATTPWKSYANAWQAAQGLTTNGKPNKSSQTIKAYSCVIIDASFL
ncbi:hypothetical protein [Megasphaera sp.]|uniref:hypothetical protein n=1 Tax=Megasphaera sp. TaxID=2023260 RepID=UPI003520F58C